MRVDGIVGGDANSPLPLEDYRLLIMEALPRAEDAARWRRAWEACADGTQELALVCPELDVSIAAERLQDPAVHHLFRAADATEGLSALLRSLARRGLPGLRGLVPDGVRPSRVRFDSFEERRTLLNHLDARLGAEHVRGSVRRAAVSVVEELVMNAMYQAPVDSHGRKIFADVPPAERVEKRSTKPISVRFAVHEGAVAVAVRDHFGSLERADVARYLWRCAREHACVERKTIGAGLGLYFVALASRKMRLTIWPGLYCEVGVLLSPASARGSGGLASLSLLVADSLEVSASGTHG